MLDVPSTIEEVALTPIQRAAWSELFLKLLFEAKHETPKATELANSCFKRMFRVDGKRWKANRNIRLGDGHGGTIENKWWYAETRT